MKKIHSFLLAAVALLAFAPGVYSQTISEEIGDLTFPNESDYDTTSDVVGYRKDISQPVNGKYWLKLEAFATGSAITTSKPSDIILLLDTSSSMTEAYGEYPESTNNGATNGRMAALKVATKDFVGSIYKNAVEARTVDPQYAGNRIAIITYNRVATDLTEGWVTISGDPTTDNSIIHPDGDTYAGSLIDDINSIRTSNGTRPDRALRLAINNLLKNGKREGANLTVLLFTDGYPTDQVGSEHGEPNQNRNKFDLAFANNALLYASKVKQEYGAVLYTVGLITSVSQANNWEYRNYRRVLQMMDWLSSNYPDAAWDESSSDEAYNLEFDIDVTFNSNDANAVYTGDNVPPPFSNDWTVGSDGSITLDNFTAGTAVTGDIDYSTVAEAGFETVFEAIAQASGGTAALNQQSQTVDVVSSSFILPEGTTKDSIKVFTAPYRFNATTKELYFDTETLAPNSNDKFDDYEYDENNQKYLVAEGVDVDAKIGVTLSDGDKISVTGFDYSDNWCGPVLNAAKDTVGAQGHKVIIMIPIMMNPDAVGGPNVETNGPGSGIYDKDGNSLVQFEPPQVSLPVNIHINTQGLEVGESAKYTIFRKAGSGSWDYVTSVFVTRHSGQGEEDPVVKIKGLPSNSAAGEYTYKVVQDEWGWSYTFSKATGIGKATTTYPDGTPVEVTNPDGVTTDLFVVNPISFINGKTQGLEPKIHYSESKATNTFNTQKVGYDDYKSNGRTVITVTSE